MSSDVARPGLSQEDRGRVEKIQHLTQAGAGSIAALIVLLNDPSWAVRRVVVTALARIGTPAVWPLCQVLVGDRASEACLAATVDALVASSGDVDDAVLELAAQTMAPAVICDAAQILGRRKSTRSIAAWSPVGLAGFRPESTTNDKLPTWKLSPTSIATGGPPRTTRCAMRVPCVESRSCTVRGGPMRTSAC